MTMFFPHLIKNHLGIRLSERCSFVMGHSLGEYTALIVAGYLRFEDAVWLVVSDGFL